MDELFLWACGYLIGIVVLVVGASLYHGDIMYVPNLISLMAWMFTTLIGWIFSWYVWMFWSVSVLDGVLKTALMLFFMWVVANDNQA